MKSIMLLAIGTAALLIFVAGPALAGNPDRIGSSGAQELLIPTGARGVGLGQALLIFADGSEALYWNPAGISRNKRSVDAMFSHMSYFADINVDYGAIAVNTGDFGSFGFGLKSVSFGDIPVTTETNPDGTGEQYSPTFVNFEAAYSKLLTDRISVGASGTLITERIMSSSATGIAFSIGVQYYGLGIPELDLAVAVKNVGPNMKYNGSNLLTTANSPTSQRGNQFYSVEAASFQLPSTMEIGLGYHKTFEGNNSILIGANFQNNNSADDVYGGGAEYGYNNLLFLRGSYLFAPQASDDPADNSKSTYQYDFTLGAGIHYEVSGVDVTFDYAYRHLKLLDANNVITLKLGF